MGGEVKREARGEEFREGEVFGHFPPEICHEPLKDLCQC